MLGELNTTLGNSSQNSLRYALHHNFYGKLSQHQVKIMPDELNITLGNSSQNSLRCGLHD